VNYARIYWIVSIFLLHLKYPEVANNKDLLDI